jgi:hypothetical protein
MLKSATGRIRRGEPGTASQDSAGAKWRALKARFTFDSAPIHHQAGTTSILTTVMSGIENQRLGMNRAFGAYLQCDRMHGAVPQVKADRAPLALRICLFCVAAAVAPAKSSRSA